MSDEQRIDRIHTYQHDDAPDEGRSNAICKFLPGQWDYFPDYAETDKKRDKSVDHRPERNSNDPPLDQNKPEDEEKACRYQ